MDISANHSKETPQELGARLALARRARRLEIVSNAGKAKLGKVSAKKLEERRVNAEVKRQIMLRAPEIVRAQMLPALGQNFVYRIDEEENEKGKVISRKHVLVTDPQEIAEALDAMEAGGEHPDDKYYYVTTKEPDWRAGDALLDRSIGKPTETLQLEAGASFSLIGLARERKKMFEARTVHAEVIVKELPEGNSSTQMP